MKRALLFLGASFVLAGVIACDDPLLLATRSPHEDAGVDSGGSVNAGGPDASTPAADAGLDAGFDAGLDGGVIAASVPVCTTSAFCWSHPLPQGNALYGIGATSASDVWAVGERGVILHFDGAHWRPTASGITTELDDVAGTSASDVWAIGAGGTILHYDGKTWSASASSATGRLFRVVALAPNDAWVVGVETLLHWNGSSWTSPLPELVGSYEYLYGIWAGGPSDVWVTSSEYVRHWDGSTWTKSLRAGPAHGPIWGASPNDVWMGDSDGNTRHWDGSTWTTVPNPAKAASTIVERLAGSASDDVYGLCTNGSLIHWDGKSWTSLPTTPTAGGTLKSLTVTSRTDVWITGEVGMLRHYDGERFEDVTDLVNFRFNKVWGTSPDDVWALDNYGDYSLHWDGKAWTWLNPRGTGFEYVADLSTAVTNAPWAAGLGTVTSHFSGPIWADHVLGFNGQAISVLSPTDTWAVGDKGFVGHWDGTSWTATQPAELGKIDLTAVWALADDDLWVGAVDGLYHRAGATWTKTLPGAVVAITSRTATDAWASVGGALYRWNGATWALSSSSSITRVWPIDAGEAWAIDGHHAYHFASDTWTDMGDVGAVNGVNAIWGPKGGKNGFWVAGAFGTILFHP